MKTKKFFFSLSLYRNINLMCRSINLLIGKKIYRMEKETIKFNFIENFNAFSYFGFVMISHVYTSMSRSGSVQEYTQT